MSTQPASVDIIRIILDAEDLMRWQDPAIEKRKDVSRPYWYIRPVVPVVTATGIVRKQRAIRLGFCDEMTERKAKQEKQRIMAAINQGKFVAECQVMFSDVLDQYVDGRLPLLGAATQEKYRNHIENHIRPAWAKCRMADIDTASVQVWLNKLAEPRPDPKHEGEMLPGLASATRADIRNIMSTIFSQAKKWRLWQGDNPIEGVEVKHVEVREKRIPKADELRRLLASLPDNVRFIVFVAAFTGLRISEVLGLKWSDIDLDAGTLTVRRRWYRGDIAPPKTKPSRRTRQLGPLAEEFRRRRPESMDVFVFAADGTAATLPDDRALNKDFLRPAAKELGLYHEGFGFHTFRRLYISWRQEVGASPFEAMMAAGHSKPSTTWMYTVTDPEREKEQLEKMVGRVN